MNYIFCIVPLLGLLMEQKRLYSVLFCLLVTISMQASDNVLADQAALKDINKANRHLLIMNMRWMKDFKEGNSRHLLSQQTKNITIPAMEELQKQAYGMQEKIINAFSVTLSTAEITNLAQKTAENQLQMIHLRNAINKEFIREHFKNKLQISSSQGAVLEKAVQEAYAPLDNMLTSLDIPTSTQKSKNSTQKSKKQK